MTPSENLKNALVFSMDFDGHRQLYVFVLTHILLKNGFAVNIIGDTEKVYTNSFYLNKLIAGQHVKVINSKDIFGANNEMSLNAVAEYQKQHNIQFTIFADADNLIPYFTKLLITKGLRLTGRNVGIFIRPWHHYQKMNFKEWFLYLKNLRHTWKYDGRFFFQFLNQRFNLLQNSVCIDESYCRDNKSYTWIPDVFQQLADEIEAENNLNQQHWIEKFEAFKLGNNVNRLLYFGTAQPRRGYAELLKLAIDLNYSFVHCGKRDENQDYGVNVQELRNELKSKNLLFETNEFLTDKNTIDYFFKSVTHLVLPYINFLSSSGVMIQALAAGIPILAPETGLMAYRIDRYQLGRTYKPGNLKVATEQFFNENPADYQESISRYMKYQSSGMLENILTDIITAEHKSQILPA